MPMNFQSLKQENVILWFGKWLMDALKAMRVREQSVCLVVLMPLIINMKPPERSIEHYASLRSKSGDNA